MEEIAHLHGFNYRFKFNSLTQPKFKISQPLFKKNMKDTEY
jgi:hypothetical protein